MIFIPTVWLLSEGIARCAAQHAQDVVRDELGLPFTPPPGGEPTYLAGRLEPDGPARASHGSFNEVMVPAARNLFYPGVHPVFPVWMWPE
jgi:hypothetical protein